MKITIDGVEIEVDDSCEVKVAGKQVSIRAKPVPLLFYWPPYYPYPYYPYPTWTTSIPGGSNISADAGNTCYTITGGSSTGSAIF